MKATPLRVECNSGGCRVECRTDFGTVWADWQNEPPRTGVDYDVEIEVPAVTLMEVRPAEDGDRNPSLSMDSNLFVNIVGTLFRDEAGGASVRLGNSVILLDAPVESIADGTAIRCTASAIRLFPIDL